MAHCCFLARNAEGVMEEIERGFTKRADEGVALMARAAVRRRRNLRAR